MSTSSLRALLNRPDQLIELEMHDLRIAVLSALNDEHHEEGDDCRPGVDRKLPRVRVMKERTGHAPCEDEQQRDAERSGRPDSQGDAVGEVSKPVIGCVAHREALVGGVT